ncbi:MAG: class I SAM-dependent methyltransferase [Oscillospiraceae bacterium]|nr:class I SAM-dependent methyltransferase [Oscillospiraceae bacterium]
MRVSRRWQDYQLLDTGAVNGVGERLERWGRYLLIRPDPQVIWQTPRRHPGWETADARYHRSAAGGGHWECPRPSSEQKLPESWQISYPLAGGPELRFNLKPMGFKHTGLFPEQAVNWDRMAEIIRTANRPIRVLNLFAYTGGATLACLAAGAHVTHVDAAKGMVAWGRENAAISGLADRPVRWLVDDCGKFVERERRRGSRYDAIIMDPPSYGRGPGGEVWKLEEQLYPLAATCAELLSESPLFFAVNSYTTGLSPSVMGYILGTLLIPRFGGGVEADEIGLPVAESGLVLPCGATGFWESSELGMRSEKLCPKS